MFHAAEVDWSERKYSLPELRESQFEYPLLVKVIEGCSSKPEADPYNLEQTKIFVFYNWGAQERVLGRNDNGVCISIPLSHEHKFLLCGEKGHNKPREALPLLKLAQQYKPPLLAEFDPGTTTVFYVDSTLHSSANFGQTKLTSAHFLEFIRCRPVHSGSVDNQLIYAMPITLRIVVVIADEESEINHSLRGLFSKLRDEARYLKGCSMNNKLPGITGYLDVFPVKNDEFQSIGCNHPETLSSIATARTTLNTSAPSSRDHEYQKLIYVRPEATPLIKSLSNTTIAEGGSHGLLQSQNAPNIRKSPSSFPNQLSVANARSQQSEDDTSSMSSPSVPPPCSHHFKENELPMNEYLYISHEQEGPQQQSTGRASRFPEEMVQPMPDGTQELTNKVAEGPDLALHPQPPCVNHPSQQGMVPAYENTCMGHLEGDRHQWSSETAPSSSQEQAQQMPDGTQNLKNREVEHPPSTSLNLPLSCTVQSPQKIPNKEQETSQPISCPSTPDEKQSPPLNLIGTAAHGQNNPGPNLLPAGSEDLVTETDFVKVPANIRCWEDIPDKAEEMSVSDVCDCLHLMGLGRHAEIFAKQQVDGCLLAACSAADFQEEFGFTHFAALKLEMLVREGWKPKLSSS